MSEVQIAIIDQEDTQITLAVPGVQGPVGNAIPSGGTTNQVLFKSSATNYDATWGNVTSAMITDLAIVNADVNASAAIAGSKISPDFGAQTIVTTGVHSAALGAAATPSISFTGDLNTGIYSPGADQLAVATNGTRRLLIDSAGALTLDTGDATIYGVRVGRGGGAVAGNTVVGSGAFQSNTTGSTNTAVGYQALQSSATADYNVAIGLQALSSNTGSANTAVGSTAVFSNTGGVDNTGIGKNAVYSNTAGNNNTGVGRDALYYSTGNNNISLGYQAGANLTNGSNNTIIGCITGTAGLADTVIIGAGTTERLRIDSSGRLLVGTSSALSNIASATPQQQIITAVDTSNTGLALINYSAAGVEPKLTLGTSQSATKGTNALLTSGNRMGAIIFTGNDGTNFIPGSSIEASLDGTSGTNDMPGKLVFSTTADGAASATERMRITSAGALLVGTTSTTANGGKLQLSSGITFPATAVAASDANTLDDYEEGTWTVTATPQTSGTITLSANTGYYTKVGRLVVATSKLTVSAVSSPIGFIKISLPFTVGTSMNGSANVIMESTGNSTSVTGFWTIVPTADTGLGMYLSAATNPSATSAQQITATSTFWFTASYFI
jgi:trimeric autotransporter adhesin